MGAFLEGLEPDASGGDVALGQQSLVSTTVEERDSLRGGQDWAEVEKCRVSVDCRWLKPSRVRESGRAGLLAQW